MLTQVPNNNTLEVSQRGVDGKFNVWKYVATQDKPFEGCWVVTRTFWSERRAQEYVAAAIQRKKRNGKGRKGRQ